MELKTSSAPLFSCLRYKLLLYQVCLSATSAPLLLQVRVTVLPSMTSPGGVTDTEGKCGASGGRDMNKFVD